MLTISDPSFLVHTTSLAPAISLTSATSALSASAPTSAPVPNEFSLTLYPYAHLSDKYHALTQQNFATSEKCSEGYYSTVSIFDIKKFNYVFSCIIQMPVTLVS